MKVNFGSLYRTYEKDFYEAKRAAKKLGLPMTNGQKLNKTEFEYSYNAAKNFLIDKKGKANPTNREILNEIIDRQQYSGTERQGRALAKAMRERGFDVDTRAARAYFLYAKEDSLDLLSPELQTHAREIQRFFSQQREYANELKSLGYDSSQIAKMVAITFYGSE